MNRPVGFSRKSAFFTTPFKRIGIFGWSDLGYDGEITGIVKQSAISSDLFDSLDIELKTFRINGKDMPLVGRRYLRAEICLCEVEISDLPKAGETIWIHGRMVWDGDGFVEIHPRNKEDVKILPAKLNKQ